MAMASLSLVIGVIVVPLVPLKSRGLNELKSPSDLLDFGEFSDCIDFGSGAGSPLLHVFNPAFDYVPPKLVNLFIPDRGGHNPSYMYRLIAVYDSADDLVLQRKPAS
ncbi:NagB/RpiA/CoA transferase-like superfamily protein [Actinidia rufa]|uniref:Translation initiation factor eIF2B subunit beta n=1 Tax=Actinidia rufa TaxID=165716 RepID=A0A7J0FV90_9ERIC|nr:NagB/RpiA/CoA transferase-like superfamily protein [Actinidia rufa]